MRHASGYTGFDCPCATVLTKHEEKDILVTRKHPGSTESTKGPYLTTSSLANNFISVFP